jgi:hypothetical protein
MGLVRSARKVGVGAFCGNVTCLVHAVILMGSRGVEECDEGCRRGVVLLKK